MFGRKKSKPDLLKPVRVIPEKEYVSHYSGNVRNTGWIKVSALVGDSYITIERLDPKSDSFDDDLAVAISKAESRAAAVGAWT